MCKKGETKKKKFHPVSKKAQCGGFSATWWCEVKLHTLLMLSQFSNICCLFLFFFYKVCIFLLCSKRHMCLLFFPDATVPHWAFKTHGDTKNPLVVATQHCFHSVALWFLMSRLQMKNINIFLKKVKLSFYAGSLLWNENRSDIIRKQSCVKVFKEFFFSLRTSAIFRPDLVAVGTRRWTGVWQVCSISNHYKTVYFETMWYFLFICDLIGRNDNVSLTCWW